MRKFEITIAYFSSDDFQSGKLPENLNSIDILEQLKPELRQDYSTSGIIYIGGTCVKNRIGTIEEGRPVI